MRYIGVDLHTNNFTVCWREKTGEECFETYGLADIERFKKQLKKSDEIALEATGNSRYFYEAVQNKVKIIVIVAPSKFAVIRKSVNKERVPNNFPN